jgi:hypothetical protein
MTPSAVNTATMSIEQILACCTSPFINDSTFIAIAAADIKIADTIQANRTKLQRALYDSNL